MFSTIHYPFTYKLAQESQRELIHNWLDQDHIKKWFPGQAVINTLEDLDLFFKGSPIFQHWIAYDQEVPFAYLLTTDVIKDPAARDIYAKWCLEEGAALTLDLFICDFDYLEKGHGVKLIHDFIKEQFPDASEVFTDPEIANTRAVQMYKNAGFEVFDEFNASWHPVPHYRMRLSTKKIR